MYLLLCLMGCGRKWSTFATIRVGRYTVVHHLSRCLSLGHSVCVCPFVSLFALFVCRPPPRVCLLFLSNSHTVCLSELSVCVSAPLRPVCFFTSFLLEKLQLSSNTPLYKRHSRCSICPSAKGINSQIPVCLNCLFSPKYPEGNQ